MKKYFFQVIREIPAERLLVFDVSEGWAPLCQFLGVAVPEEEPFPRTNDAAQQLARLAALKRHCALVWTLLLAGVAGAQITHHTGFATFVPIFHEICSTYSFTAVHLLKRIFGTNILEICIHISVLCRCIHTKGYWMHTYTKYAPIYPPLRMYSYEVCLVQTYSKYAHTYTNCVLNRIIEHQVQMSLDIYCLFRIFYVPLHVSQVCPG